MIGVCVGVALSRICLVLGVGLSSIFSSGNVPCNGVFDNLFTCVGDVVERDICFAFSYIINIFFGNPSFLRISLVAPSIVDDESGVLTKYILPLLNPPSESYIS